MWLGFTTPVPVGRMALAVLIRLLVGWVDMLPADLPGLKHGGEQRSSCQGPFSSHLQTLCLRQFHESRDLFLFLTRPALHAHRGTWHVAGLGSKGGDWWVWHMTDEWRRCCLVSGRQESGSNEGTAGCEQADLSFPRGLGRRQKALDQDGGRFRGERWDSSGLALGWWEEKFYPITRPQKLLSEGRLQPGPPRSWPHHCWDLSSSSSVPWPQAELQTLSRPPSGPQGKLLREWRGTDRLLNLWTSGSGRVTREQVTLSFWTSVSTSVKGAVNVSTS